MAKLSIVAGATSQSVNVFIQANNVTTGAGLTGLVFNSTLLTAYYAFTGANGGSNVISLATLSTPTSAYSSGGFKEIDATNMPGLYRLDLPTAVLAGSKGRSVTVMLSGFATMAPCVLEIELTAVDNQSTGFGLVNASANVAQINGQTTSASGTITFPNATLASTTNITAGTITTATNLTNAPTSGDFTATMKTSLNSSTPTSITTVTGNVNGSVGSVTGAVGSVTGNVSGSVASVIAGVTVTTNNDKTGYSLTQTFPSNFSSLAITAGGAAKIDGTSALTESYAAQGAALTLAQALYAMNQLMGQQSVAGTTLTTKKRDGSTQAKTYTLDSSTAPTTISETT